MPHLVTLIPLFPFITFWSVHRFLSIFSSISNHTRLTLLPLRSLITGHITTRFALFTSLTDLPLISFVTLGANGALIAWRSLDAVQCLAGRALFTLGTVRARFTGIT